MKEIYKLKDFCSIPDCKKYLTIFSDFLFGSMAVLHQQGERTFALEEGKLIIQQVFFKTLSVQKMLDGVSYNKGFAYLRPIIDYSSIYSVVREVYELLFVTELLFVKPDTEDKKLIMFDLFQIQGFKERQKYVPTTTEELKERYNQEKIDLEECSKEIQGTQFYKDLSKSDKAKVDNYIKSGTFRVLLDDNNIRKVGFEELGEICGVKVGAFDNIYSFMSLHAHPSFVALMQLESAYQVRSSWEEIACSAVMQLVSLLSIFVADCCKIFPLMKEYFSTQPDEIRFAIDFYNSCMRDDSHVIEPLDMHKLFMKLSEELNGLNKCI